MAAPLIAVENIIRIVTGSPLTVGDLNAEIAIQNAASFQFSSLEFIDTNTAAILFGKIPSGYYYTLEQKLNQVTPTQMDVDDDIDTESGNDYMPTGIFVTIDGDFLIAYQKASAPL